jgi:hypothetical protein
LVTHYVLRFTFPFHAISFFGTLKPMDSRLTQRSLFWGLLFLVVVIGYWLIPIPGQVLLVSDDWLEINAWPQVRITSEELRPGQEASLLIYDTVPWPHVKLLVEGVDGRLEGYEQNASSGVITWEWIFRLPQTAAATLHFYHNCHTGCQPWTSVTIGPAATAVSPPNPIPTKLGVVFPHPKREWHNRGGWVVELTYAQLAEADYWGIDDLARRVQAAQAKGLNVLVRLDYAQGQSLPPPDDFLALDSYLSYAQRLAQDARLQGVHGYIIGSGYNGLGSNSQSPANPVTPAWVARLFNGYGAPPGQSDNLVQTMRPANPQVRLLIGPVTPWIDDQDGPLPYEIDMPWLNDFHSVVAYLDEAAQAKAALGISQMSPDGFAVQAPGRPDAPELTADQRHLEPRLDLTRPGWQGAQAGFGVYRDWQAIVNSFPYSNGRSLYITASNTFTADTGTPPAQNYPDGWLTIALAVANEEPQIAALCWFVDYFPHDDQWAFFSLTNPRGQMVNAAAEFERLLRE